MYTERETWLAAAAVLIAQDVFAPVNIPELKSRYRVSCGFPIGYRGSRSGKVVLGQAFDPAVSADGTHELFINPLLDAPGDVLGVLVHELLHVHAGIQCGHRGEFARSARAVGLEGALTATVPGAALRKVLEGIAETLGPYPHAKVDPSLRKKQTTRLLKLHCGGCGWVARVSALQANRLSPGSHCPCCGIVGSLIVEGNENAE